jgi:hypothetical protein
MILDYSAPHGGWHHKAAIRRRCWLADSSIPTPVTLSGRGTRQVSARTARSRKQRSTKCSRSSAWPSRSSTCSLQDQGNQRPGNQGQAFRGHFRTGAGQGLLAPANAARGHRPSRDHQQAERVPSGGRLPDEFRMRMLGLARDMVAQSTPEQLRCPGADILI